MSDRFSRIIHVRVGSDLREALAQEAAASGVSLSRLARARLGTGVDHGRTRPEDRDPPPAAPASTPARLAA